VSNAGQGERSHFVSAKQEGAVNIKKFLRSSSSPIIFFASSFLLKYYFQIDCLRFFDTCKGSPSFLQSF